MRTESGLTRPRRLMPGDRVMVVAPSGPVSKDLLEAGCARLRSWGLDVTVAPHALDRHERLDYLAGSDADRAGDLQRAWLDPDIAAVLCARGGYGASRIVDLLDWPAMRRVPPKVFAGYSDITALHEAFATRLGLATVHAPMVATAPFVDDEPTAEGMRATLFAPETARRLAGPAAETLVAGSASGVTLGGCLSVLADHAATPLSRANAAGGIVLLEDVGEECYRLDRRLTRLRRAGWFEGAAAVALGSWRACGPDPSTLREMALDRLGDLGVPVVWELGFGHGPSLTVPLGVAATLDADEAVLTLDVPALR